MANKVKLFPRNLTARASELVKGNPAGSRLESGVDNCYPGLEFDQRNLDQRFFPGLKFEYHLARGARLVEVEEGSMPHKEGLTQEDVEKNPIYLWVIVGSFGATAKDDIQELGTTGLNGLEVWRRVHDLQSGRVAILLGNGDGFSHLTSLQLLGDVAKSFEAETQDVQRDDGRFLSAVFVSERESYLNAEGVIKPDVFRPGELTRSLCSPWQYDFRDCGCFYWAANKPDIVTSGDGTQSMLNFMRRDRERPQPENPLDAWERDQELDYADLVNGAWNDMPVVVNDREAQSYAPHVVELEELMDPDQVIAELNYLATVEHALCVEYLYAHYSINAPQSPQEDHTPEARRRFAAAREVFSIAVDEMRHLRWVNEALAMLGQKPVLGRATHIHRTMNRPFELAPLTRAQLKWFIEVEKPSQEIGETIDGMYVRLLLSVEKQPVLFPESDRLIHLFKLIIDEGEDHYQRFLSIKSHLTGLEEADYLRPLDADPDDRSQALQKLADQNYHVMLGTLGVAFSFEDESNGRLLEVARRAMYNLHDSAHHLAGNGVDIKFTMPAADFLDFAGADFPSRLGSMKDGFNSTAEAVKPLLQASESEMVERQQRINDEMFEKMKRIISGLNE